MINFIIANKEWLFSGIGVAVIGLLARWLLKSYKTARSKKIDSYQELSQTILSRREKPDNFYDISLKVGKWGQPLTWDKMINPIMGSALDSSKMGAMVTSLIINTDFFLAIL